MTRWRHGRCTSSNATQGASPQDAGLYEDGGGLRLVVSETGARRWVMRISVRGKRHQLGLGSYPVVTLERAREKAAEIRRQATEGHDSPATGAPRQGHDISPILRPLFENKRKSLSNAKHAAQWRSTMEAYVFPTIGDRPVADIGSRRYLRIMTPIWFRKPETARRVLQRIGGRVLVSILRGRRERASACIGVRRSWALEWRRPTHHRSLPYPEVPAFVAQLRAMDACLRRGWPLSG